MAIGKNKRVSKGGRKGSKKKVLDPFSKKEWYTCKAPSMFAIRNFGNTLATRSQGTKIAADSLKGRVYEVNLADLQTYDGAGHRKVKLCCEEVQGRNCLTDFHGMDITRDHFCSLIRKWHSLIEGTVDVKTLDGYQLRMSCIAFTKRKANQQKATCYAQSSQVRAIRAKMVKLMDEEASKCLMRDLVKKLIPGAVGKQVEKSSRRIFPLENGCVRKVKVVKKPKADIARLMELYQETAEEARAGAAEATEAKNLLTADVAAVQK